MIHCTAPHHCRAGSVFVFLLDAMLVKAAAPLRFCLLVVQAKVERLVVSCTEADARKAARQSNVKEAFTLQGDKFYARGRHTEVRVAACLWLPSLDEISARWCRGELGRRSGPMVVPISRLDHLFL